ncbi:hypothetical protein D0B32_27510 [Paraburkholderia sp. DHOC27]|nr:hypothetical protein D0B32_27510 [Paraburkholderia sp. DHOC27]
MKRFVGTTIVQEIEQQACLMCRTDMGVRGLRRHGECWDERRHLARAEGVEQPKMRGITNLVP